MTDAGITGRAAPPPHRPEGNAGAWAIPTLVTERLTLRAPGPGDHPAFAAFYESDAARHVGGPMAPALSWRYLSEVIGHWAMRGFGRWAVDRRDAPGRAVGLVGLHFPLDWPEPEVGWYVWEGLGRGYAKEAGRAALRHAYETLGWTTAISMIKPGNDASAGVARALGAVREADHAHPRFGTMMIFRHPGPEALGSGSLGPEAPR